MIKQLNMGVLGAVALLTPLSALATTFNCGSSHPTCAQLGFNQTANECKGYKAIKCPFNEQALFCGDSTNVPESVPGSESMTCSTRDCDALGYNRTAEECERTHTRLACPFNPHNEGEDPNNENRYYCGGYNCVAGDTLYTDSNNNIGCWKGSDANGKTPIGFMLNDKVAIDLSFYGSAYSGENYVRNIGGHSGQIVWRNVGVQSGIVCEKKTSSATGLFSAVTNEVKDCNGAPFSEVEVPYGNVFSINDYDQTFSNTGVATSGGYYTTTTSNNGYYITNLLANNGAFNINIDRYVPVCNVTAMEQLLEDVCDISPASISSADFTKLKTNVLREIYAMRELKKSVYSAAVTGQTWLPYMNSLPDKLNVTWTKFSFAAPHTPNAATVTAAINLQAICKDLRRGNCASPYIDTSTNKFRPIVKVKPLLAQNYVKPHVTGNFGLRGATVPQAVAELSETFQSASVLPSRTIYNCSCGMKKVEQFPMMRIKELSSGFINPRLTGISANGTLSFASAPSGAAATRKIGLSSEAAKLCVGRTAGGQDWFLPAPGDIKNLMEDPEMLEKYRQALVAAGSVSSVFPSGFNGHNFAYVPSPAEKLKTELGRTITSAMYLSNSSGTTTGVMCPLQRTNNDATSRDRGDVTYSWDLQLSLLGDVVHCVTLVGVDASQYENVANVGKKSICGDSDPAVPEISRPSRFSSIIEAREKIVPGEDLSNEATMSVSTFSGISASSFHDRLDKQGL